MRKFQSKVLPLLAAALLCISSASVFANGGAGVLCNTGACKFANIIGCSGACTVVALNVTCTCIPAPAGASNPCYCAATLINVEEDPMAP